MCAKAKPKNRTDNNQSIHKSRHFSSNINYVFHQLIHVHEHISVTDALCYNIWIKAVAYKTSKGSLSTDSC